VLGPDLKDAFATIDFLNLLPISIDTFETAANRRAATLAVGSLHIQ